MPRLSKIERERAFGMLQVGESTNAVARHFQCSVRTIQRLRQRVNETGQTSDRPRSGRPRVTTRGDDQYLRNIHLRDRFLTVTSSSENALAHRVSRHTVARRLREIGIRAYQYDLIFDCDKCELSLFDFTA